MIWMNRAIRNSFILIFNEIMWRWLSQMITRQWRRNVCVSPTHVNNMQCSKVLFFFINEKVTTREKKVSITVRYIDSTPVWNIWGAMRTADELLWNDLIVKCRVAAHNLYIYIYINKTFKQKQNKKIQYI